jgi:hypothetical protein
MDTKMLRIDRLVFAMTIRRQGRKFVLGCGSKCSQFLTFIPIKMEVYDFPLNWTTRLGSCRWGTIQFCANSAHARIRQRLWCATQLAP